MLKHVSVYKNMFFIYLYVSVVNLYASVEVFSLLSLPQLNGGNWNESQLVLQIEEFKKIG